VSGGGGGDAGGGGADTGGRGETGGNGDTGGSGGGAVGTAVAEVPGGGTPIASKTVVSRSGSSSGGKGVGVGVDTAAYSILRVRISIPSGPVE
jgi:hypothetical protein